MRSIRFNSRHEVHSIYESREEGDSQLNDRNLSQLPRDTVRASLSAVKAALVLSHEMTPLMVQLFRELCDLTAKPS